MNRNSVLFVNIITHQRKYISAKRKRAGKWMVSRRTRAGGWEELGRGSRMGGRRAW